MEAISYLENMCMCKVCSKFLLWGLHPPHNSGSVWSIHFFSTGLKLGLGFSILGGLDPFLSFPGGVDLASLFIWGGHPSPTTLIRITLASSGFTLNDAILNRKLKGPYADHILILQGSTGSSKFFWYQMTAHIFRWQIQYFSFKFFIVLEI